MNTADFIRAHLLGKAMESEKKNWKIRAWAVVWSTVAVGYFCLFLHVKIFSPSLLSQTMLFEIVAIFPSAIMGAIAFFAFLVSSENEIMELRSEEIEKIDGKSGIWHNLPTVGKVMLVLGGGICALSVITFISRIAYACLT